MHRTIPKVGLALVFMPLLVGCTNTTTTRTNAQADHVKVEAFVADLFERRAQSGDSAMLAFMTEHFGPDRGAAALKTMRLTYGDLVGTTIKSSLTEVVSKNGSEDWKAEVEMVTTYSRVACDESVDVVGDGKQFKVTGYSSYIQVE